MSDNDETFLLFNPLPWAREISGSIAGSIVHPDPMIPGNETSVRHGQDRDKTAGSYLLAPREIPGFGHAVVSEDELIEVEDWPFDERATVETDAFLVEFDRERGGISRWYDKRSDRELVDPDAEYRLGSVVYEEVADTESDEPRERLYRHQPDEIDPVGLWNAAPDLIEAKLEEESIRDPLGGPQTDWHATRTGPTSVERHRVYETPLGPQVEQRLTLPQLDEPVELSVFIPNDDDQIIVEGTWTMSQRTHPKATYMTFPFDIDDPVAHVDVGNQAIEPGSDQLSGTCHDYYTAQRWVDLSGDDHGVTVGCPLNPMVQFGDFQFGRQQTSFELDRALLLGWVTNNYWDTNFRAHQPGPVKARYHLRPHDGFDESAAHRHGMEAEHWEPLGQTLADPRAQEAPLPTDSGLLDLPEPPVIVESLGQSSQFGGDDGVQLLLWNASDEAQTASIGSGALRIESASSVDLYGLGTDEQVGTISDGTVTLDLEPREVTPIRLRCTVE